VVRADLPPVLHPVTVVALLATLVLIFALPGRQPPGELVPRRPDRDPSPDPGLLTAASPTADEAPEGAATPSPPRAPSSARATSSSSRSPRPSRCNGPGSGAALATVVGVLVEVPVMLRSAPSATGRATGSRRLRLRRPPPETPDEEARPRPVHRQLLPVPDRRGVDSPSPRRPRRGMVGRDASFLRPPPGDRGHVRGGGRPLLSLEQSVESLREISFDLVVTGLRLGARGLPRSSRGRSAPCTARSRTPLRRGRAKTPSPSSAASETRSGPLSSRSWNGSWLARAGERREAAGETGVGGAP